MMMVARRTPQELGLPFPSWLRYQEDVVLAAHNSPKPIVAIEAPTGSGKTMIAAAAAYLSGNKAVYSCSSKALQDQVLRDFPFAVELKGRSSYPCVLDPGSFPDVSAEHCQHRAGFECEKLEQCEYRVAKRRALAARLAVLNLPYFLEEVNHVGAFEGSHFLILDEADLVDDALMSHVEISISASMLERLKIRDLPEHKTKPESWITWASNALGAASDRVKVLEEERDRRPTYDFRLQREIVALGRLCSRLRFFVSGSPDNWVYDPVDGRVVFKPVWVSGFARSRLFSHVKGKTLAMSATLQPEQWVRDLGLDFNDVDMIHVPSTFPVWRRPIYYLPVANMTMKTFEQEAPKVLEAIDNLLDCYPGERGLIQSVSYVLAKFIMERSRHRRRLVSHDSASRDEVVKKYVDGEGFGADAVLVSPSFVRGLDLKGDLARFVVIPKVAWPDRGDKQVAKRLYAGGDRGQRWYLAATARSVVQASGRAMRASDDYADTWILDQQFGRLLEQGGWLFPKWWLEALRPIDVSAALETVTKQRKENVTNGKSPQYSA